MDIINFIIIFITGIAAGFLNIMAGGGSLITLAVLIFLGCPSAVANGTNRIAIILQNIVAVFNYRKNGYFDWKLALLFGIPALFGSIIGSNIAISLPDEIFNKILAFIMILVLIFIIWQPHKKVNSEIENISLKRKIISIIIFFFIGIYGGFIQAGVGFIIIASLVLITGMSLVRINCLKIFIVLIYMFASLAIFISNGQIDWSLGIVLSIGNVLGAWLGTKYALKKGDKSIRIFLIFSMIIMSIYLFIK